MAFPRVSSMYDQLEVEIAEKIGFAEFHSGSSRIGRTAVFHCFPFTVQGNPSPLPPGVLAQCPVFPRMTTSFEGEARLLPVNSG